MEKIIEIFLLRICVLFAILEYSSPTLSKILATDARGPDVTLSSDPRSRTTSLGGLGLIAIDHLRDCITGTSSNVEGLLKQKWHPYTAQYLKDCSELYANSSMTMTEVEQGYKGKRYADVLTRLSAVEDMTDLCEYLFEEQKLLTKQNEEEDWSSSLALAVVDLIPK